MNISDRTPVNRSAALVTSKGFNYKASKKITCAHSVTPIPIDKKSCVHLRLRRGRLTVCGYLLNKTSRLVVRCDCGIYTIRTIKSITNKNNDTDRCEECRHLVYLKRADIYRRTGKWVDNCDIY